MFLKCSDGDGQEGRGAGRQAPPPPSQSGEPQRAEEGHKGQAGPQLLPGTASAPPTGASGFQASSTKGPSPPTCQLSCCLDCVTQRFDQTGALCTDNYFKYQGFGVSLALGPLSVLCQKNYALNPYISCSPP